MIMKFIHQDFVITKTDSVCIQSSWGFGLSAFWGLSFKNI